MTAFVDSVLGRRAAKKNPTDGLFYVKVPGIGIQEFNSLKDAEWGAKEFKKDKKADTVSIVDALDRTSIGGYRLIKQWKRGDDGRWRVSSKSGRIHV